MAALVLTTGCVEVGEAPTAVTLEGSPPVFLPEAQAGQLILFNRFTQHLVAYDPATFSVASETNATNYSQYGFPTGGGYFTTGDAQGRDFRIIRVEGNEVETVLELPDREGVYPFIADGDRLLFLHSTYDESSREISRSLVRLEEGELLPYNKVTGPVDRGAVIDGQLYFTTYVPDEDEYQLSVLPIAEPDAEPRVLESGLPAAGLYVHNGKLFTSTLEGLVHGDESYQCVDLCWFRDELGILLRMRLNEEASLSLDVIDTVTRKVLETRSDVVDFAVEGAELVVYRQGSIDRIAVDGLAR